MNSDVPAQTWQKNCFLFFFTEASPINICIFNKGNNSMPPPSAYLYVDLETP